MKYNKRVGRWEIKYSTINSKGEWHEIFSWCWQTFGHPGIDPKTRIKNDWDYHGGWFYLYSEKYVTTWMLRWS